jgi:hypothetical protein
MVIAAQRLLPAGVEESTFGAPKTITSALSTPLRELPSAASFQKKRDPGASPG